jgi:nucleosome binding factor SPN SPT16 subunit
MTAIADVLFQPFEDPDATFIRSVTYRSVDGHRFDTVSKQITELKKEVNKREQQKKELADVIEQDTLVEIKGRRPHKLQEVFIRPPLDGKRLPGEVEIHQNGVRYQSPMGSQKIGTSSMCPRFDQTHLCRLQIFSSAISSISSSNRAIMNSSLFYTFI